MSDKDSCHYSAGYSETSLTPVVDDDIIHRQMMDDLQLYAGLLNERGEIDRAKELRQLFEHRYTEPLAHFRRVMQLCPDEEVDPDGYAGWMESQRYWYDFAEKDMRTASLVRRLATSINEKINANQPKPSTHLNKQGNLVDEHGKDYFEEPEGNEFSALTRGMEALSGVAVPLSRFQALDIIETLDRQIGTEYGELYLYADLEFQERDGGEMYDIDGNLHIIEPNFEHQRGYAEVEARVVSKVDQLRQILGRYVVLLSAEQQKMYIYKYKLDSPTPKIAP